MNDFQFEPMRVAVLGATGWLGRTFVDALLQHEGLTLALFASRPRELNLRGRELQVRKSSLDAVAKFAPDLVVNAAFLTREKVEVLGDRDYIRKATALTDQFLQIARLPTVRFALTLSSGAASPRYLKSDLFGSNIYGALKRVEESRLLSLASPDKRVLVLRIYSISGKFVLRPHDYAFSDLILQAPTGLIEVRAESPTFRRYVSAFDLANVGMATLLSCNVEVIESGGVRIELGDLAHSIRDTVNPEARVSRKMLSTDFISEYHSDNVSWEAACSLLSYREMSLHAQIRDVQRALLEGH